MDRPWYWGTLAAVAFVGLLVRLAARRPLWPRKARAVPPIELAVAAVAVAALVFHCGAMFFASWVDAIPFAEPAADAVRALGLVSQVAYWLPAAAAVLALRRVWAPALVTLLVTLVGVGLTMFLSYPLDMHLAWIAASMVTLVLIGTILVTRGGQKRAAEDPRPVPA